MEDSEEVANDSAALYEEGLSEPGSQAVPEIEEETNGPTREDGNEQTIEEEEDEFDEEEPELLENDENENDDLQDNVEAQPDVAPSPTKKARRFKSEVKKVTSKWILFSNEVRSLVMAEHPTYGFSEVAKVVAERYRNISPEESERLDALVAQDRERYKQELAEAEDDAPASVRIAEDAAVLSTTLAFPMVSVAESCNCFWCG
jgi:hypothetical protein